MLLRTANSASVATASMVTAALLAACAGAPPAPPPPPPLGSVPLAPAQLELCRDFEQAYRARDPEIAALRERAVADPEVSVWLTRMFVRDVLASREGRAVAEHDDPDARADAGYETRAIAELQLFGAAAVPVLVDDLLRHDQPQPRDLGVELLGYIGAPAVPAVARLAASPDPRQRRAVGRALGAIGAGPEAMPALRRLATDDDFAVRADALRELHAGGTPARDLLIERLRDDGDAFVRRVAAGSLPWFPSRASALALVDYLRRCQRDGDMRGETVAQDALQLLAGTRGMRSEASWRAWAEALAADA